MDEMIVRSHEDPKTMLTRLLRASQSGPFSCPILIKNQIAWSFMRCHRVSRNVKEEGFKEAFEHHQMSRNAEQVLYDNEEKFQAVTVHQVEHQAKGKPSYKVSYRVRREKRRRKGTGTGTRTGTGRRKLTYHG